MAAELNKAFFLTWSVAQLVLVGCPALALDIQFSSGSARQRTPLACTHTAALRGKREKYVQALAQAPARPRSLSGTRTEIIRGSLIRLWQCGGTIGGVTNL